MISEWKETASVTIPPGWRLDYLENLSTTSSGTTPSRSAEERYYENGTTHWVKTMDLTNSNVSATEELVTKIALDETSLRIYPVGTVLVAMYGGFNQIGRTGLLKIPAAVNQAITAIQANPKLLVSEYLINVLNYRVNYWKTVASSSRKDPNITSHDIKKFPIIFPGDTKEQRAIATALSDVDALIASLDKLIAKKRDIKQATMQQLLTGKTRLPGFGKSLKAAAFKQTEAGIIPEDWGVYSLGDIVTKVGSGITPRGGEKVYKKDGHPFLRSQNIGWGHLLLDDIVFIDEETHSSFSATEIKHNDVLLNITGASIGRSAVANNRLRGGNVNQHVCIIRVDANKLNSYYLNFFLLSEIGQKQIDSFQAGGNRQGLNFGQIKSFQIPLPEQQDTPSLPEQTAIATVLSDMDAEIAALEQKRHKTRALKQGVMQELLAGKIRLI
jgi:type I restriction enzyme, S subunit